MKNKWESNSDYEEEEEEEKDHGAILHYILFYRLHSGRSFVVVCWLARWTMIWYPCDSAFDLNACYYSVNTSVIIIIVVLMKPAELNYEGLVRVTIDPQYKHHCSAFVFIVCWCLIRPANQQCDSLIFGHVGFASKATVLSCVVTASVLRFSVLAQCL